MLKKPHVGIGVSTDEDDYVGIAAGTFDEFQDFDHAFFRLCLALRHG